MHKTAIQYARKHRINLGRDEKTGLYFIAGAPPHATKVLGRYVTALSVFPTASSAIVMMQRYLRSARATTPAN
jgi:hypothetical protein